VRDLQGKVVVLTGASSGIGRSTALALARERAIVHLVARREAELHKVADEVRALGGTAHAHVLDICDSDAFQRFATTVHHVDILINNAGVGATKGFMDTTPEDWRWTFDVNVHAMVTGIRAFVPGMLERGHGLIVNIASLAGVAGSVLPAYTASKFAVVGLSESLAVEYGDKGIDVVVVCPGLVQTEIADASVVAGRWEARTLASMREAIDQHGVSPDVIARDILRAIRRPRFLVLTPMHAKVIRTIHHWAPGLSRALTRRMSALTDPR
jgi:short-subunit dehydrogenase